MRTAPTRTPSNVPPGRSRRARPPASYLPTPAPRAPTATRTTTTTGPRRLTTARSRRPAVVSTRRRCGTTGSSGCRPTRSGGRCLTSRPLTTRRRVWTDDARRRATAATGIASLDPRCPASHRSTRRECAPLPAPDVSVPTTSKTSYNAGGTRTSTSDGRRAAGGRCAGVTAPQLRPPAACTTVLGPHTRLSPRLRREPPAR